MPGLISVHYSTPPPLSFLPPIKLQIDIMKILIIATSHEELGTTGRKTGLWLEELAIPYYLFKDIGAVITLASPKGGAIPLDPKSESIIASTSTMVST